jgi:hypothetical protein
MLEKRQLLQQIVLGKLYSHTRRLKLDPCVLPCTIINSKGNKYFNLRPEPLKLLLEKIGKTQEYVPIGNNFLNRIPIAQKNKRND